MLSPQPLDPGDDLGRQAVRAASGCGAAIRQLVPGTVARGLAAGRRNEPIRLHRDSCHGKGTEQCTAHGRLVPIANIFSDNDP